MSLHAPCSIRTLTESPISAAMRSINAMFDNAARHGYVVNCCGSAAAVQRRPAHKSKTTLAAGRERRRQVRELYDGGMRQCDICATTGLSKTYVHNVVRA